VPHASIAEDPWWRRTAFRYPRRLMDRQTAFLLALALLIVAAAFVSASGWILFVRDRRASRSVAERQRSEAPAGEHPAAR
jgi:hypothetical protein